MMIWDALRGHANQREMFLRAISRGRLPHALLLCGPSGIGKQRFARILAQCLFCEKYTDHELNACGQCPSCRQMQAETHPDFLFVECPEGKREFPIDLIAGRRENRGREGLCYDISLKPVASDRKIALLDDVDLMNEESANAFLKTLEEPPEYATLILLAGSRDSLLPTIQSRCQIVRFSRLSDDDVAELLLDLQMVESAEEARRLAPMCDGSLETASQLLTSESRELRKTVLDILAKPDFHATESAEKVIEVLESLGDTNAQRQGVVWVVHYCMEHFRQRLRELSSEHSEGTDETTYFAAEQIGMMMERSAEALRQIESMAPVALCVQGLFNDLPRFARQ
ncbi:MAG: DNA polymerase III subunit delta' [Planctomycetaceae bacterium]